MPGIVTRYEVIIIGSGITGLSAALHLARPSMKVAVVSDPGHPPSSARGPGLVTSGLMDNFTRVVVAHGEAFASELWRWGGRAFEELEAYALRNGVPWQKGRRVRLVVTPEEHTEVREATAALGKAGLTAALREPEEGLGSRVLAIQDEGLSAAWTDNAALLAALKNESRHATWRSARVEKIDRQASHLTLHTSDGVMEAQMVILANHLNARSLLPEMKEVLVPYADQWLSMAFENPLPRTWQEPGRVFSAFHGYVWGVIRGARELSLGGGRFLRPMAGIGAEEATVEPKVTKYLKDQSEALWPGRGTVTVKDAGSFLECLPCDELPVIGPYFGDSRILLAGGYMGSGLTMGFWAGKCLADFVQNGRCADLPARLLPSRLRSLS